MASEKESAALISVLASAVLTIAKLVIGFASGSLAIIAEAGHSALDLGATLVTYFAIRVADKPADENHPYGHGKAEPLAALAETMLLFGLSGLVIAESARRLFGAHEPPEVTPIMVGVMVVAIIIDFWRARRLMQVAKQTNSAALEADALHFTSDMLASGVVLMGLGLVWLGFKQGDTVAAIAVAVLVGVLGWKLARRTIDMLMDMAPAELTEKVTTAVRETPGIAGVERIRLRSQGSQVLADIEVRVSRALPLEQVVAIKMRVTEAAQLAIPDLVASVIAHPVALDDETVMERIYIIARHEALAIHHVTVHHVGDRLAIGLDLEVDGDASLGEAHDIASRLEEAIKSELGPQTEVEVHIEPLQVESLSGTDAPVEVTRQLTETLANLAASGPISDIHNVRARQTDRGLIVHYHCRAPQSLTVDAVHRAVDAIEHHLRSSDARVARLVGHAEPLR